jgi:antitoxin YefM
MPEAINYTEARKKLAATMDKVVNDHETVIITRQKAEPVVMMSLAEYNAIQETAYLLKSPANAERLRESIKQAERGEAGERELID